MSKRETIRRLLWGDLLKGLRVGYGNPLTLPDDDSGKDDLYLMLRIAAVADQAADKKMRAVIELYAPWAEDAERAWLDELQNDDSRRVWLGGKELGERLRLTNAERESLKVWRIAPVNLDGELISAEDLAEQRKAKKRNRQRERRKRAGAVSRQAYLANAKQKLKPWEAEGVSRATWYRRRETSPCPTIVDKADTDLSQRLSPMEPSKGFQQEG